MPLCSIKKFAQGLLICKHHSGNNYRWKLSKKAEILKEKLSMIIQLIFISQLRTLTSPIYIKTFLLL